MQSKLIFLISFSLVASLALSGDELITKTCKSTPDVQICESSLRSDPRSSTADTVGLIQIMIDVVKSKFTDSLVYVSTLIKKTPPPIKMTALNNCFTVFRSVINDEVPEAKYAVSHGNPKFGVDAMRSSAVDADSCRSGVSGPASAELIQRSTFLSKLSNVAAAMLTVLE